MQNIITVAGPGATSAARVMAILYHTAANLESVMFGTSPRGGRLYIILPLITSFPRKLTGRPTYQKQEFLNATPAFDYIISNVI